MIVFLKKWWRLYVCLDIGLWLVQLGGKITARGWLMVDRATMGTGRK